jgi:hypothetical protein
VAIRTFAPHQDAVIEDGTRLYRISSPLFSSKSDVLNGRGALTQQGRYHQVHQFTSYCSDNVLVSISEILFHMSRHALRSLANNMPLASWLSRAVVPRHLVILEMSRIDSLIYIDTDDCRNQTALHAGQIVHSSLLIHPDELYYPLQMASNFYRNASRLGVVYPSARHSRGLALALFLDHTNNIKNILGTLDITLSLVDESSEKPVSNAFNPAQDKISQTRGYFQMKVSDFSRYQRLLYPLPSSSGVIDFVRTNYSHYPQDAVR